MHQPITDRLSSLGESIRYHEKKYQLDDVEAELNINKKEKVKGHQSKIVSQIYKLDQE
jgi:hypothetical protein